MTDASPTPREPRPRPRYGEYATPQDQAEAIAGSLPPVSPLLVPRDRAVAVGDWAPPAASERRPTDPPKVSTNPSSLDGDRAASARPGRRWDVVVSIGLLAYMLVTVLSGFTTLSDLGALFDRIYATQGIGDFTSDSLADAMGIAINIINVAIFTITLAITVRVLRARRLAFYIPLAGGVLSIAVMLILLALVVFSDPAFVAFADANS